MAITTSGSFIQTHVAGQTTQAFTVANVGDLLVAFHAIDAPTTNITGMSGNNSLGTMSSTTSFSDAGSGTTVRMFWARAGATGTTTVTATYSASIAGVATQWDGWMFTAGTGAGTTWTTDTSNTRLTTSGSGAGSMPYPSLTAAGSGELYVGCGVANGTGSAGSTSGFSYNVDSGFTNVFCYNLSSSGTLAPTAGDTASADKMTVGALIIVGSSSAVQPAIVMPSLAASQASIW